MHLLFEHRTGAQPGKRADPRTRADRRPFEVRERANPRPLPDRDAGAESDVRFDDHIAVEPSVGAEEHCLGRHEGSSGFHRRAAQAALHERLGLGELGAGVDAEQLLGEKLDGSAIEPIAARDMYDIRQIEFTLCVIAVESVHEIAEVTRLDRHDAAIDERNGALLRRGVRGLDDPLEEPVGREDEFGHRGRDRPAACRRRERLPKCAAARSSTETTYRS